MHHREDQTITLWDVDTGRCLHTLKGHKNWVRSVAFSPDGNMLASGSGDKTVKLWNLSTGKCLYTLQEHSDTIWSVAFNPDGKTFASSSDDGTIRIWDIKTGKCLKILSTPRPWEGTNLTGVTGLSEAQRANLIALGAFISTN